MRPEHPAWLVAILSPWLLLACSSAGVSHPGSSGGGGNGGVAGNGGGGTILSTSQSARPDAASEPPPPGCGDGILAKDEACDDHNTRSNDGCSADCRRVEPGYSCIPAGQPCHQIARCGDGLKVPPEQCDDGNTVAGDGCSPICQIETGFQCSGTQPNDPNDTSTSVCTPTVCGDGKVEGGESCDDGNSMPFDGCSADCRYEPNCASAPCLPMCGDGLVVLYGYGDADVAASVTSFRQNEQFYYLTGWNEPEAIMLLAPKAHAHGSTAELEEEILYIPSHDRGEEKWTGPKLAPEDLRATGMGIYHMSNGLAAFAASAIAGLLWQALGFKATFIFGSVAALLAVATFVFLGKSER